VRGPDPPRRTGLGLGLGLGLAAQKRLGSGPGSGPVQTIAIKRLTEHLGFLGPFFFLKAEAFLFVLILVS
jgi:hypothetical protein